MSSCGSKVNGTSEQTDPFVTSAPTGSRLIGTIITKGVPAQPFVPEGITVYVALSALP
jgi:hypothetical protein